MLHQCYRLLFYTEQEMLKKQKAFIVLASTTDGKVHRRENGIFELSIRPISHHLSIHKSLLTFRWIAAVKTQFDCKTQSFHNAWATLRSELFAKSFYFLFDIEILSGKLFTQCENSLSSQLTVTQWKMEISQRFLHYSIDFTYSAIVEIF